MENTKPHFFKPLVNPNFHSELVIPATFFTRYLNNREGCEKALLKTSDEKKRWEVVIDQGRMVDGWNFFVEDNDLQRGDFLVFGYERNCSFRVSIFDLTACERDYPYFDSSQIDVGCGGDDDDIDEACSVEQSEFDAFRTPNDKKVPKRIEKIENMKRKFEAGATYLKSGNPYFVATLMPSYVKSKRLRIPAYFSRQHGLNSAKCPSIVIKDQLQRPWKVGISEKVKGSSVFYFRTGWHAFCVANHLKEGDSFIFELTKTGSEPTFQFHDNDDPKEIEKKENKKRRTEANETSLSISYTTGETYFYGTITATHLSKNEMKFPREFARSNGLNDRNEMIKLRNINGESWHVRLGKQKWNFHRAYLARGWIKFAVDNGLKVGDRFKLEVVKNKEDDMLIMNYYGGSMIKREMISKAEVTLLKSPETSFTEKQKSTSRAKGVSYNRGESYFCGIITKWHLINNQMRLPVDFARSNGLDKKCNEMIKLRYNNGESWQVFLGRRKSDGLVYIGRGWSEFANENKLKAGDRFKLEAAIDRDALIINYLGLGDKSTLVPEMTSNSSPTATAVQETASDSKPTTTIVPATSSGKKCNAMIEQEWTSI